MRTVQKQIEEIAANQVIAIQEEFNVENFSPNFILQLNELTPCFIKEIVHQSLLWYVGAWQNDLFAAYPDEDASDIELVDLILEKQPALHNSRGVIEHVIAAAHFREYPFPVDQDIMDSLSEPEGGVEKQMKDSPPRRSGITNPGTRSKGRKRRYP